MKVSQCSAVLLAIGLLSTSALAGNVTVNGQLISTVGTGTPPLQVSSTTEVQNLNAEFVGGVSVDGLRLANIVTVGKNGTGDFSTIQAAIDGVDASWDNPHLVFIGPGTYEEQVTTRSHVYLKGSGTNRTIIRYTGGNTLDASSATLTLGSSDRTRTPVASDLYIDSDTAGSGAMVALAVAVGTPGSTMMENVFIRANGTLASVGVYNTSATLYINDARIVADINGTWSSYGIWNDGGALHLSRVDIEAVYGEQATRYTN